MTTPTPETRLGPISQVLDEKVRLAHERRDELSVEAGDTWRWRAILDYFLGQHAVAPRPAQDLRQDLVARAARIRERIQALDQAVLEVQAIAGRHRGRPDLADTDWPEVPDPVAAAEEAEPSLPSAPPNVPLDWIGGAPCAAWTGGRLGFDDLQTMARRDQADNPARWASPRRQPVESGVDASYYDDNHNAYGDVARLVLRDCAWMDEDAPPLEKDFWPSENPPQTGAERLIWDCGSSETAPHTGSRLWVRFTPPLGAVNGWEDFPETICQTVFALCRVVAVESPRRLRVAVEDILPILDLEHRFAAVPTDRLMTEQIAQRSLFVHDDWELLVALWQEAGWSLLGRREGGLVHIVYGDQWYGFGDGEYDREWVGHCVVSAEEWRRLREEPPQLVRTR